MTPFDWLLLGLLITVGALAVGPQLVVRLRLWWRWRQLHRLPYQRAPYASIDEIIDLLDAIHDEMVDNQTRTVS